MPASTACAWTIASSSGENRTLTIAPRCWRSDFRLHAGSATGSPKRLDRRASLRSAPQAHAPSCLLSCPPLPPSRQLCGCAVPARDRSHVPDYLQGHNSNGERSTARAIAKHQPRCSQPLLVRYVDRLVQPDLSDLRCRDAMSSKVRLIDLIELKVFRITWMQASKTRRSEFMPPSRLMPA
jgi:hypothetical protein